MEFSYEKIGGGIEICVSKQHTFGTDAFLLSHFATPKRKDNVCDLGTGCGIIPLLWLRESETTPVHVWAVDIQEQAVTQMEDTKKRSHLENFTPLLADLCKIKDVLPVGSMDVVTCNPPYNLPGTGYMSQSESDRIARHETNCTFDDICKAAAWLLRSGGRFCICQLPERMIDMVTTMRENHLEAKRIRFVQQHGSSSPWLVLIEGKRNAKPFLQIDPPLLLKTETGATSEEMQQIYGMYGKVEG